MSDINQVVIHWESKGTRQHLQLPQVQWVEILNGNNMGWSLDYEIGAIDGDNNFGEI